MTRVLLLGAGATRGTLGDQVPVARDFGRHLEDFYARYLFADAIARRAPERNLKVTLYQMPERRDEAEREIHILFQTAERGACPIEFRGPVTP